MELEVENLEEQPLFLEEYDPFFILKHQEIDGVFRRWGVIVRYIFIDHYFKKGEEHSIYRRECRMKNILVRKEDIPIGNVEKRFITIINNISLNGYTNDKDFLAEKGFKITIPPILFSDLFLKDGMHRLACCLFFENKIQVKIEEFNLLDYSMYKELSWYRDKLGEEEANLLLKTKRYLLHEEDNVEVIDKENRNLNNGGNEMDITKLNLPIGGGLTSGGEQLLYDYSQGTLCVDMGTFLGRCAILLSLKTKKVITIDAFFDKGSLYDKYPNYRFDSVKNSFEKYGNIELVKGMAEDAELTKILGMKKIDVLFVDVEPTFDVLSQIGDAWFPHVKKNKFIIINNFQRFEGVTAFVEELTLSSDYEEVDCVDSCVVIKKLKA